MELEALKKRFEEIYGKGKSRIFIGPARVNLIGEHTDYNGGYVFPCALGLRSACVVRPRDDGKINLVSTSHPLNVSADIRNLGEYKHLQWGNYQLGVAYIMQQEGYLLTGYDMLFDETVPHESGLASSAAIELATAMTIATLDSEVIGRPIDRVALARIGQRAENEYIGINCGIMDEFASSMGKRGHAVLLKCSSLEYTYVPFAPEMLGYRMVITNTNKPRALVTSKYNERRAECDRSVADLQKALPHITCLADVSVELFEEHKDVIQNETDRKRAQHVVYENERAWDAVGALREGDFKKFGALLCQSHDSLCDLYEVTGEELDALYEGALKVDGVMGSRMTGAGFGGCTVSIVKTENIERFEFVVGEYFRKKIGIKPHFFTTGAEEGAREVSI